MTSTDGSRKRDKNITRYFHRLIWNGMLQNKKYFALWLLDIPHFILVHAFIPLQIAYTLQAIFQQNIENAKTHITYITVTCVITGLLNMTANLADNRLATSTVAYVQRKVFTNFLSKDNEFYSNQFVGSLGVQASQLVEATSLYVHELKFQVLKNASLVVGSLAVIVLNAPVLALITVICMLFVLSFTIITSSYRLRFRRVASEAGSELAGVVGDALGQATTVKSFGSERYELENLEQPLSKWKKATLKAWDTVEPTNTFRTILTYFTISLLLWITARLYINGEITIAIVILIQLYMVRLVAATTEIADILKQYERIMGMAYTAIKTMQIKPTIIDPKDAKKFSQKPREVRFSNVNFYYDDKSSKVIDNFNLTLRKGEKVGLVGYSGAGKTTLTKLMLRFMDVSEGSIKLDGNDLRDITQHDLRKNISYVPQEPLLFHRSIKENIAYANPEASDDVIKKAAASAYVDEFADNLVNKLDTLVGERGVKLSGGQRQRVAIARAILKDAPILVLDEATSALDSRSEKFIQNALWHLMEDRTVLVIAHRLSTVQRMNTIVVMDKGKIVQKGTHKTLLKKKGIYQELWEHQSGGYLGGVSREE